MDLGRLDNLWRRAVFGRKLDVWYDPAFRLPIEGVGGFDTRRADLALWYLVDSYAIQQRSIRRPRKVRYRELALAHTDEYLESLGNPRELARIFAIDESEVRADELMTSVRLACGATVDAARICLHKQRRALVLFGGFHHAAPDRGQGFCAVNDVAVAVANLRAEGFDGRVAVLDLDAHPPDGLALCFQDDPKVWIGSISGMEWGALPGVDETLLPKGTGDDEYLGALRKLLRRMRRPQLAFVLAGGDVLAGDHVGGLSLTLEGARRRDSTVARALWGVPVVWLPAGGYTQRAWRVVSGTGLVVSCGSERTIPEDYDPMRAYFGWVSGTLNREHLGDASSLGVDEIAQDLGLRPSAHKLLGYYTSEGVEHALSHFGILPHVRRLGFDPFRVVVEPNSLGDCCRLEGRANGQWHLLLEAVLEKRQSGQEKFLYVHWLTLRNPRAQFTQRRPKLPGQDQPGLGVAREIGWVLARMARRLGLEGVMFRPAWYHTAYSGRYHFVFVNPQRQGRFEAMMRDLGSKHLITVTKAAAEGRILLNGQRYTWEADEMAFWLRAPRFDEAALEAEKNRLRFTLVQ